MPFRLLVSCSIIKQKRPAVFTERVKRLLRCRWMLHCLQTPNCCSGFFQVSVRVFLAACRTLEWAGRQAHGKGKGLHVCCSQHLARLEKEGPAQNSFRTGKDRDISMWKTTVRMKECLRSKEYKEAIHDMHLSNEKVISEFDEMARVEGEVKTGRQKWGEGGGMWIQEFYRTPSTLGPKVT